MKISRIEDMHADGGWRIMSYLKISTDDGIVGWSEFHEGMAGPGLTMVIRVLAARLIGQDPRDVGPIAARLYANSRMAEGGILQQAIAAITNALMDIKGKAVGLPVHDLLGGAHRKRLPVYWSHCGSYRIRHAPVLETEAATPPIRSLDDIVTLGAEVARRGFRALKTNVILFDGPAPYQYRPGFSGLPPSPDLVMPDSLPGATADLMAAFRQGAGADVGLMLDLNFNFRPEAIRCLARAAEPYGLTWLEVDTYNPQALARIRSETTVPIASLEAVYGQKTFRAFLEAGAVDVGIIDVQWNGILEAMRLATQAESHDVLIAAHSAHGFLSTMMGAHMCAAIENFRILEFDVDEVPWMPDLYSAAPVIEDGHYVMPGAPGWGVDVNEEGVLAHPPRAGAEVWMFDYHKLHQR